MTMLIVFCIIAFVFGIGACHYNNERLYQKRQKRLNDEEERIKELLDSNYSYMFYKYFFSLDPENNYFKKGNDYFKIAERSFDLSTSFHKEDLVDRVYMPLSCITAKKIERASLRQLNSLYQPVNKESALIEIAEILEQRRQQAIIEAEKQYLNNLDALNNVV